ncbi:MAG: hypothetical protein ACE5EW_01070 [Thermoplasmata archaeon]
MRAGIDASPLIFLTKLEALDVLTYYEEVLTTAEVIGEVLPEARPEDTEALRVHQALEAEVVKMGEGRGRLERDFGLGRGEISILVLAGQEGLDEVIMDDRAAIGVAKYLGFRVVSTPFLLLRERVAGRWPRERFDQALDRLLAANYYLSPRLLERIRKAARRGED